MTGLRVESHERGGALSVDQVIDRAGGQDAMFGGQRPGIQTPIAWLNRKMGGLRPGQLIIIAARPGVGKTALACQIAEHAPRHPAPPFIFSLEMSDAQLLKRLVVCGAYFD